MITLSRSNWPVGPGGAGSRLRRARGWTQAMRWVHDMHAIGVVIGSSVMYCVFHDHGKLQSVG